MIRISRRQNIQIIQEIKRDFLLEAPNKQIPRKNFTILWNHQNSKQCFESCWICIWNLIWRLRKEISRKSDNLLFSGLTEKQQSGRTFWKQTFQFVANSNGCFVTNVTRKAQKPRFRKPHKVSYYIRLLETTSSDLFLTKSPLLCELHPKRDFCIGFHCTHSWKADCESRSKNTQKSKIQQILTSTQRGTSNINQIQEILLCFSRLAFLRINCGGYSKFIRMAIAPKIWETNKIGSLENTKSLLFAETLKNANLFQK